MAVCAPWCTHTMKNEKKATKPEYPIFTVAGLATEGKLRPFAPTNVASNVRTTTPKSGFFAHNIVAEALQSEAAFTNFQSKKPVVATYGCGSCVAFGGYDSVNQVAFIVHFASAREVTASGTMLLAELKKLVKKPITQKTPIKVYISGGLKKHSEELVRLIERLTTARADLPMQIIKKDVCNTCGGKSLLIDSRTGNATPYNPFENPYHREITEQETTYALKSAIDPHIHIAYTPTDT